MFERVPPCSLEGQSWILDQFLSLLSTEGNFAAVLNIDLCSHVKPPNIDEVPRLVRSGGETSARVWTSLFEGSALMEKLVKVYER